ncbi:MAG: PaaI family thioesterase [Myxococcota bacterium]
MGGDVAKWIEGSPYSAGLGVLVESVREDGVSLRLPYKDENSNPGKALHGGVAASMVALGGQAVGRVALGAEALPLYTAAVQVDYLSAAIDEPIRAEATLLRKGKEICFSSVRVETLEGKAIAQGLLLVHGRFAADPGSLPPASGDAGAADPGPMGPHIQRVPFISRLGLQVEHMTGGSSRIVMPWKELNGDDAGGVHEGALLALLDTTGAMASWAETGPGRFKASTPGMQARILAPPPRSTLVGYGRVVHRDRSLFFAEVEVATAEDSRRVAQGTVVYRIVTG